MSGVTTDVERIYNRWNYLPQMRGAILAFEEHVRTLLDQSRAVHKAVDKLRCSLFNCVANQHLNSGLCLPPTFWIDID